MVADAGSMIGKRNCGQRELISTYKGIYLMSIQDYRLHKSNLKQFAQLIYDLTQTDKSYRVSFKEWRDKRSQSQNQTVHMWFGEMAAYLTANGWHSAVHNSQGKKVGEIPFSAEDCKDFFVGHFAGHNEDGTRLSTAKMDKGELNHLMNQIHEWCVNRNVPLTIPEDSEYMRIKQEMGE